MRNLSCRRDGLSDATVDAICDLLLCMSQKFTGSFHISDFTCRLGANVAKLELPRAALHQTTGRRGKVVVAGEHSNALQRHTTCAEVHHHQISTFPASRLINCHIEFMGESTFGLGGLHVREAHHEAPQRLERGGWLCEYDVEERQLTKAEYRALR